MSKQVRIPDNIELASSSSDTSVKAKSNLSSMPRKYKALLLVAGVLAVVAVGLLIAVTVGTSIVFSRSGHSEDAEQPGDPLIDDDTRMQLLKQVADSRSTIAKRQADRGNMEASCYSIRTNTTHPAAHISGKGFKWTGLEPGSPNHQQDFGYQSSWVCANRSDAFVDGGMYFSQKEKKLYVPTCGYYYVSSQVFFQSNMNPSQGDSNSKYIRHQLRIERNCSSLTESQNRVTLLTYSSFPRTSGSITRATTNIGDVVKLCAGGNIYVEIPEDRFNPCCPYGRSQSTYLSAFMVSETSCDPSVPLNHPPSPAAEE